MKKMFLILVLNGLVSSVGPTVAGPVFSGGPGYVSLPLLTVAGDSGTWASGLQDIDFDDHGTAYLFAGNRYIRKQDPGRPAEELYDYGTPVYGSFVRLLGETVYFGESSAGTVKSIPAGGGEASDLFILGNIYDCAFNSQSRLFFSANPDWTGNQIYAWWEGEPALVLVAEVGGYSGPLAFDGEDNLYYGRSTAYPPGPEEIVYFSAAAVAGAIETATPLTPDDWTVFAAGADAPGALVFDRNGPSANLFSAAAGPGTLSRISPSGVSLVGRGSYPGLISFSGTGRLDPFLPSRGVLGVAVTDYDDSYDSTLFLIRSCPQNHILGGGDYGSSGQSGIAVFRPLSGLWAVRGLTRIYFGRSGDLPVAGDYSGEGTARPAVFRASSGLWADSGGRRVYFGRQDDIPVPRDYTAGGTADRAVFRPSSGLWAVRGLTRAYFGSAGDFPLPGDYNGSQTTAPAVFRPPTGLWAVRGVTRVYFGRPGDLPVPGDYAGSGTSAPAVYRPESGLWAVRGLTRFHFGSPNSGDIPVPLDLNGDGVLDPAIFRPSSGLWAVRGLTRVYFGSADDFPAAR